MGDKIKKSPHIRFAGFTDDWKQRKLGEISEKITEKNKNNMYSETLTNSAELGIINQRDFFDKDISNEKNLDGYYIVRPDDFVYNPRISNHAPVGPINRNKLGRSGVMSPLYYVFRTHSVDKIFLEKYFSSDSWHKFMKLNGDSGARADRFAIKDSVFREMPIPSPSIEEQTKVGEYFQSIDNLITLHQRKLDLLKVTKKSMLQKMFPKDGESVPEIRFAGFTDAWEQRELGKMGDTFTGLSGKTKEDFGHGDAKFVTYINVFGNVISDPGGVESVEIDNKQNQVKYGDVFFTTSSETPEEVGMASVWIKNTENVYLNSFCFGYRPTVKFDVYYLAFMLRSAEIRKKFMLLAQGISRYNISKNKVMEMKVPVPELNEQRKVGTFFRNLDNLITLHQRELDLLKDLKKSMLQQMFI